MQILGWAGFIKVDGVSFSFLGVPSVPGTTFNKATQKSASVSIVVLHCFSVSDSIFVVYFDPEQIRIVRWSC